MPSFTTKTPGRLFTLIELLVVIAIISILMAILLPGLKEAKRQAHINGCRNHEKQLYYGLSMYVMDSDDYVPRPLAKETNRDGHHTWGLTGYGDGKACGLGLLFAHGYINSPATFYCPGSPNFYGYYARYFAPSYNWMTSAPGWINSNYAYRFAGNSSNPFIYPFPKLDQWKGRAILSDLTTILSEPLPREDINLIHSSATGTFAAANPHISGYGMNTAYHDGHIEFARVRDWVNNLYGYAYPALNNRFPSYDFWKIADKRNGATTTQ